MDKEIEELEEALFRGSFFGPDPEDEEEPEDDEDDGIPF